MYIYIQLPCTAFKLNRMYAPTQVCCFEKTVCNMISKIEA